MPLDQKILTAAIAVLAAAVWTALVFRLAPRIRLVRPNFAGKLIMSSYGIAMVGWVAAGIAASIHLGYTPPRTATLYLAVIGAMCLLGAVDDIFGSRDVGGFKGHFKKLLFERKLTTGAAKALGGGVVGILAGWAVADGDILKWVTAALVIPLSANILNLVDLRPGRAVAVFFAELGVTYMWACGRLTAPWSVAVIALVALVFACLDSRGRAMMGDSGSNALGAALGVTIALDTGVGFQVAAILCFVAVHWYSEKHSITKLIERNRVLRAIDSKLGVR